MNWWMAFALVVVVVGMAEAAEPARPLSIDLEMKNDSGVPAEVLEKSQGEVTRIFADAGLVVRWTETSPRFTVTILPQALGYATAGSRVMGVAQRKPNGPAVHVFFRQVHAFSQTYRLDRAIVLAYVIAHEIGHLLMPGNAHSPTGVMQAAWDEALVRDAARGSLTFTEVQAARIRGSL